MVRFLVNDFHRMNMTLLMCIFNLLICACSSAPAKSQEKLSAGMEGEHTPSQNEEWSFTPPAIPIALVSMGAKTEYLVEHFWENYDFTDTLAISRPEYAEQTLVNYLSILSGNMGEEQAKGCLRKLADDMRKDSTVYAWFDEKLEHYLYDPNSPMRNDEYYMGVLEGILKSDRYQEVEKIRPEFRMQMLRKNRKGTRVENFAYTLIGGIRGRLYDIKSPYTLLFLYDPECENCRRAIEMMVESTVIQELTTVTKGMAEAPVMVLTVCVEHDLDSWKEHLSILPEYWLNGFDDRHQIREKELYDLRSFPSLYLLDSNKRVILKDVNVQDVIDYFTKQS